MCNVNLGVKIQGLVCRKFGSVQFSRSVVSDSWRPHGLQPTGLLCPWDFPGKSTGVLEWAAIAFSEVVTLLETKYQKVELICLARILECRQTSPTTLKNWRDHRYWIGWTVVWFLAWFPVSCPGNTSPELPLLRTTSYWNAKPFTLRMHANTCVGLYNG